MSENKKDPQLENESVNNDEIMEGGQMDTGEVSADNQPEETSAPQNDEDIAEEQTEEDLSDVEELENATEDEAQEEIDALIAAKKGKAPRKKKKKLNTAFGKKFRYGSLSVVATVLFIVGVVIVNIIAQLLLDRFPLKLDVTANKLYEVSDQTKDYLKGLKLDQEIKVTILSNQATFKSNELNTMVAELLQKYQTLNKKIKVSYVDIEKNPLFVNQYEEELTSGNIIVEYDGRVKVLDGEDLFDFTAYQQSGSYDDIKFTGEKAFTLAIMMVTASDTPVATFITGHGETDLTAFKDLLKDNGFEVREQNLMVDKIDEKSVFTIICAPTKDYTEAETKKLDAFLNNNNKYGKHVIYFAAYNQPKLPYLDAFLSDWGITVGEGIIYEGDSSKTYFGNQFFNQLEFSESDYSADMGDMVGYTYAGRPLTYDTTPSGGLTITEILGYSDTAKLGKLDESGKLESPDDDVTGNFSAMVLSKLTKYDTDANEMNSSVMAINAIDFVSETFLAEPTVANGDLTLNVINKLLGRENTINIISKDLSSTKLDITSQQSTVLSVIFMWAVPIIVLAIGVIIFIRRRYL